MDRRGIKNLVFFRGDRMAENLGPGDGLLFSREQVKRDLKRKSVRGALNRVIANALQ